MATLGRMGPRGPNERWVTFAPKAPILTVLCRGSCRLRRTAVSGGLKTLEFFANGEPSPFAIPVKERDSESTASFGFLRVPASPFYSTSTACREEEQFAPLLPTRLASKINKRCEMLRPHTRPRAHSLLLHSFIPSYEYSTDYPIKCSWTFELFLIEAFMNKAIMNITVQVSFFF